jgi:hypothetical protein
MMMMMMMAYIRSIIDWSMVKEDDMFSENDTADDDRYKNDVTGDDGGNDDRYGHVFGPYLLLSIGCFALFVMAAHTIAYYVDGVDWSVGTFKLKYHGKNSDTYKIELGDSDIVTSLQLDNEL